MKKEFVVTGQPARAKATRGQELSILTGTRSISVADIDLGRRYRENMGDTSILARSINEVGLINLPTVIDKQEYTGDLSDYFINSPHDASKRYLLIAGGRRVAACVLLKWESISCKVYRTTVSEFEYRMIELEENLNRLDMSPAEQAQAVDAIHSALKEVKAGQGKDHTMADTARRVGTSREQVRRETKRARYVEMFPELQHAKSTKDIDTFISSIEMQAKNDTAARVQEGKKAVTTVETQTRVLEESYKIGDAFEGLEGLDSESVDFLEMDPPYCTTNLDKVSDHLLVNSYEEITLEEYPAFLTNLLTLGYDKLRDNNWSILWHSYEMAGLCIETARAAGFAVHPIPGAWIKPTGRTSNPKRVLASCMENFLILRKGSPMLAIPGSTNVFFAPAPHKSARVHSAERPLLLIEQILKVFCVAGSTICVPFLGSGNTILAADNVNMLGFGWDKGKAYRDAYIERLSRCRMPASGKWKLRTEDMN